MICETATSRKLSYCLRSGIAIAALVWGDSAWAQSEPANNSASQGNDTGFADIIVTARKREERLQDVPVAITAVTGVDLQRTGTQSFAQLATKVPQLQIGAATTPAGNVISLRGIGSSGLTASVDQAVSLNLDGVQISQANGLQLGIFDVQRIEVLKGPQALFFGKNSPGGIISLISSTPTATFESRLRVGYEAANQQKFGEIMVSGPLTDTLRARVVGYASTQNGWFRNVSQAIPNAAAVAGVSAVGSTVKTSPKQDEYFTRGTLTYEHPAGKFDATLKVAYGQVDRDNGATASNQIFDCPTGTPQNYGALLPLLPGVAVDCKLDRNYVDPNIPPEIVAAAPGIFSKSRPYYLSRQTLASLPANYNLADTVTLSSVSGFYKLRDEWTGTFLGSDIVGIGNKNGNDVRQFTQELRVATSFDGPANFLLGGFYQDFKLATFSSIVFAGPLFAGGGPPFLAADDHFEQHTTAYSIFGQMSVKLTPDLEATAGARYSYERKRAVGFRNASALSGGTTVPLRFDRPEVSFNDVSPEFTLTYKPTSSLTIYGAYREGFVSGGYNLAAFLIPGANGIITNSTYRPATVRGGELGIKGGLADGQITFDLTGYLYKYSDLQLSAALPAPAIGLVLRNAGTATVKGIEFAIQGAPRALPGFRPRVAVAYNHGRYNTFDNAPCYGGQTQAQGCNLGLISAGPPAVFQAQNLSGRQLVRAPDWSASLGFTYERPLTDALTLALSADSSYTGPYNAEFESDPRARQRSIWRHDASIALRGVEDAWEIALIGKNLSNQLRIVSAFSLSGTGSQPGLVGPSLLSDKHGSVSEPRTVLVQLTLRETLFHR